MKIELPWFRSFVFLLLLGNGLPAQEAVIQRADELFAGRDDGDQLKEAVSLLNQSVIRYPSRYEILWRISKYAYMLGDRDTEKTERLKQFESGIDAAKKAIAIDTNRPEAHFWLGANYGGYAEEKGMWKSLSMIKPIRLEFETVLHSTPGYENGAVYLALGELYLKVPGFLGGNDRTGLQLLEKGVREADTNAELKLTLARYYAKQKRTEESKRLLRSVMEMDDPYKSKVETNELRKKAEMLLTKLK